MKLGGSVARRIQWSRNVIQHFLGAAQEYATGLKTQSRGGESFEIAVEPIIDSAIYEAFLRVRETNTNYPSRHQKHDYLIGGLLYCACGRRWGARSESLKRRNRKGEWVDRNQHGRYYCRQIHEEHISPDCPRQIGMVKADNEVWGKVCTAINNPEILLAEAQKLVYELRINVDSLENEQERIQKELDALILERQWVITQARRGGISENDMDYQLGTLDLQELSLKQDLATVLEQAQIHYSEDWEEHVRDYLADLQLGVASLDFEDGSPEDAQEIFEIKRQTVTTLVRQVTIDRDRKLHVEIGLDLSKILSNVASTRFERKNKGEIKTTGIRPGWRDDS